jgi:uncharacterized membrane protein (DUF2068 family)
MKTSNEIEVAVYEPVYVYQLTPKIRIAVWKILRLNVIIFMVRIRISGEKSRL